MSVDARIEPRDWVEPAARAGFLARGALYGIIAILALLLALGARAARPPTSRALCA